MDEADVIQDFNHESDKPPPLEMHSNELLVNILTRNDDNDQELEPPVLVSSVCSITSAGISNGFHKSTLCNDEHKGGEGEDKQSNAYVGCLDAPGLLSHISTSSEASFHTKSKWKTDKEDNDVHKSRKGCGIVSSENKDAVVCSSGMKDNEDNESSKQLKELMEFLQAPTDYTKASLLSEKKNDFKSERLDELDGNNASKNIASSLHFIGSATNDGNDDGDAEEEITCNFQTNIMTKNLTLQSQGDEHTLLSNSIPFSPEYLELAPEDDNMPELTKIVCESLKRRVSHSDDDDSETKTNETSQADYQLLKSANPLPPSHRPIKKRIGLENILLRRLLQAAKPVNHSSNSVSENGMILDSLRDVEPVGNSLHLDKSVQILTDHPKSIAVLENEANSSKIPIKEFLGLNSSSLISEDSMNDDSESNSKKMHKRKCSSPQRIIKKSLIKIEHDSEVELSQSSTLSQVPSVSQISKPNPCTVLTTSSTSASLSSKIFAQTTQQKTSLLSNPVPFMPGLPMNVITIAPDESYIESSQFLRPKLTSTRSLRQLAPKTANSSSNSQNALTNGLMTSRTITNPTSVIPISLVQSTTTPSLVILVNKTDSKGAKFISAQPLQLHQQQKQLQISTAEQNRPNLSLIPNLIQNPIQLSQPQRFLKYPSITSSKVLPSTGTLLSPVFPKISNAAASRPMPKLRLCDDGTTSSSKLKCSATTNCSPLSPTNALENFFEPFRNRCIIGKFVTSQTELPNLGLGAPCATGSSCHACGSCGCIFPSEMALKEHVERKSFQVTFECSCRSAGVAQACSTFYNLCSFSIFYRNHVLQHPYVPHSPANGYKVSFLPDDQLPEGSLKLLKEKEKYSAMAIEGTMISDPISVESGKPLIDETRPVIQCKECNKEFRLPLRIKQHFQNNCNRSTAKTGILEKNIGAVSALANYRCSQCMIVLPNSCSFKAHTRLHNSVEPYVCPECGLTFSTFEVMKEHAYKICYHGCRKANIRGCRFCNFILINSTSTAEALDNHISKVHMCSLLKCPQCSEIFQDSISIHKHSQMKHGSVFLNDDIELVCKCPVCEIVLSSSPEMHLSGHSLEKKSKAYFFSCTECDKNFVYRGELEKHLRSSGHLGMKVNGFVCKLCTLTYPSREDRCNHIINEHSDLKSMFTSELNSESSTMPLIGPKEIMSPSSINSLCGNKVMPNLHLIDHFNVANATNALLGVKNAGHHEPSKESLVSKDSTMLLVTSQSQPSVSIHSSITSKESLVSNYVSSSTLNDTKVASPERWECSRCNEIFLNQAAFHRHHQKHRFLEQNKSKKRKLFASAIDAGSSLASGNASAAKDTNATCVAFDDSFAAPVANSNVFASTSTSSDTPHVSLESNEGMKEVDNEFADIASEDLVEPNKQDASTTNCSILPKLLQESQDQSPILTQGSSQAPGIQHNLSQDGQDFVKENRWHSCQLCCLSFNSYDMLQSHIVSCHVGLHSIKPETYACAYCPEANKRVFPSVRHLHKHLRVKHKIIRKRAGQYASLDVNYKLDPTIQHGLTASDTKESEVSSDGKCASEPCATSPASDPCGDVTPDDAMAGTAEVEDSKDAVNVKSRKIYGSEGDYICSYCSYYNYDRSSFWEHIVTHEGEFLNTKAISKHKTFQCPECGSMFVVRIALLRHLKLVHKMSKLQEYEAELGHFHIFRQHHINIFNPSSDQIQDANSPEGDQDIQDDLPASKLAKLASLRPEDIHSSMGHSQKFNLFLKDTPFDDYSLLHKRQGLRSQIKPDSMNAPSSDNQAQNSPDEYQEFSQNECQVCYKTFDNHVELKVHMRVHGMAFIQGTRRSSASSLPSSVASTSTSASTNQKALVV